MCDLSYLILREVAAKHVHTRVIFSKVISAQAKYLSNEILVCSLLLFMEIWGNCAVNNNNFKNPVLRWKIQEFEC